MTRKAERVERKGTGFSHEVKKRKGTQKGRRVKLWDLKEKKSSEKSCERLKKGRKRDMKSFSLISRFR